MASVRDMDILGWIVSALKGTGAFNGVYMSDPPELSGKQAAYRALAVVQPVGGDESAEGWDDPDESQWARKVEWRLVILARDPDPTTRDRLAERLLNVARGAVDADASILDATIIGRTHIYRDRWLPAVPPERQIEAIGTFTYLIDGPSGHAIDQ